MIRGTPANIAPGPTSKPASRMRAARSRPPTFRGKIFATTVKSVTRIGQAPNSSLASRASSALAGCHGRRLVMSASRGYYYGRFLMSTHGGRATRGLRRSRDRRAGPSRDAVNDTRADGRIRVLFMQSQRYFGADSMIHGLGMRYLDRRRVQVYAACNSGPPEERSAAFEALERIPDLALRTVNFGPTVNAVSHRAIARTALLTGLPCAAPGR